MSQQHLSPVKLRQGAASSAGTPICRQLPGPHASQHRQELGQEAAMEQSREDVREPGLELILVLWVQM